MRLLAYFFGAFGLCLLCRISSKSSAAEAPNPPMRVMTDGAVCSANNNNYADNNNNYNSIASKRRRHFFECPQTTSTTTTTTTTTTEAPTKAEENSLDLRILCLVILLALVSCDGSRERVVFVQK
ncbi:hypothetical protein niasHS_018053 [Heterodera schachtii]|uniref:Uncharacterized protein n=1 Tax=Heterodera schachtii TaxID=97005 RepID=A0ABD2HT08_HETSC